MFDCVDIAPAVRAHLRPSEILAILRRFERGDWGDGMGTPRDGYYFLASYQHDGQAVNVLIDHRHERERVELVDGA